MRIRFRGPVGDAAPVASSVSISGTASVDNTLTASYTYTGGRAESGTIVTWFRDGTPIAHGPTYTLTVDDIGAAMTVSVQPRSLTGAAGGIVTSAATSAVAGAEQHYMPFNGTTDYGAAIAAATGVKDALGWTLLVKISGRASAIADGYAQVHDEHATFPRNLVTWIYSGQSGSNRVAALGYETDGTDNYRLLPTLEDATGVQVLAAAHRDTAAMAATFYVARGGSTLSSTSSGVNEARTPLHVGVGCALNGSSAPVATYHAAANVVAVVLLRDLASEAEVQAYSLADDARSVWADARIFGYWPMSRTVDDEVPNLGSGTAVPIALVGPVQADLVAL